MNTTVNIRIDKKAKIEASKTLSKLGLDMSTAVKMFLYQVVAEQGLPFTPTKNPATIRARFDAQTKEALERPGYKTAKEALRSL
jgi:DNA-damage-inducible protein J